MIDEAKRSLVQNWLHKAQRDLATARKLGAGPDPYFDTAIYHCQQPPKIRQRVSRLP